MTLLLKIAGIVVCCIGLLLWYIDYLIFTAIGALTSWIAEAAGITGNAVLGVQIIGWILTLGIMILMLVLGVYAIIGGFGMVVEG